MMLNWPFKRPAKHRQRVALGLMSGTSLDGLDAVLVQETDGYRLEVLFTDSQPMPESLRSAFQAISRGDPVSINRLLQLESQYTDAVITQCKAIIARHQAPIDVIGWHGQTLWHAPAVQASLQIGQCERLATATGCPVAGQFRQGDLARGGQGAPLAPLFHASHFTRDTEAVAVLNLGGIANLTVLAPGRPLQGWDIGPANTLSDQWYQAHHGGHYDQNGDLARQGTVHPELLHQLLETPYFQKEPPKSTGQDMFNLGWLHAKLAAFKSITPADVQSTLNALTATLVARALPASCELLVVCGGGCFNRDLMKRIDDGVDALLVTSDLFGIDPVAVEGACFAWLGLQRLDNQVQDTRTLTGAETPGLLGTLYYP